eukprot:m.136534 g.136534  ORF g.136534 m.136534 type:complete len:190 (+) comp10729_c0_seq1:120-689(+)
MSVELGIDVDPPVRFDKSNYIVTHNGNKVHRRSVLGGSQNIVLKGKSIVSNNCVFRGDLGKIKVGKMCIFEEGVIIHPSFKIFPDNTPSFKFLQMEIGENVTVGQNSIVSAAKVDSYVSIGKNCVIGRRCMLSERCRIEDDTVLAPDTIVPPYAIFAGNPGKRIGTTAELTDQLQAERILTQYNNFQSQ